MTTVAPHSLPPKKSQRTKPGKPVNIARYLWRGDCGYYARMGVPASLRSIIGKREFWVAIAASTDAGAKRKLHAVVAGFEATLNSARAQAMATRLENDAPQKGRSLTPHELAASHYGDQMRFDDECRNADHRYAMGFISDDYVQRLRDIVSGSADNQSIQEALGWIARKFTANGNLKAHFGSADWRAALRALAVAELESLSRTAERDEGDFTGQPRDPLLTQKPEAVPATDTLAARCLGPDSTKTLTEVAVDYCRERKASGPTNYENGNTFRLFNECMGEEKPIFRITRKDIRAFKDMLAELPLIYRAHFPGKTAPEAVIANKARKEPRPVLSARTINEKYLSRMHAVLAWCCKEDLIPDNPAAHVSIDSVSKHNEARKNFSAGDLTKIFALPLFDPTKPYGERQWALLMALFTGARPTEVAQIKLDSIGHRRGCLVVEIEEETKTAGSKRVVPVHSTLIALGFEQRVAELRAKGETHLFAEWYRKGMEAKAAALAKGKSTLTHHFPRFIPRWFNVTLKPEIGITDGRKVFYSFRHTFKTGLKDAGVEKAMRDDLCGHDDNSAGAVYLHGESIEAKKIAIEKLRYDGFTLTDRARETPCDERI